VLKNTRQRTLGKEFVCRLFFCLALDKTFFLSAGKKTIGKSFGTRQRAESSYMLYIYLHFSLGFIEVLTDISINMHSFWFLFYINLKANSIKKCWLGKYLVGLTRLSYLEVLSSRSRGGTVSIPSAQLQILATPLTSDILTHYSTYPTFKPTSWLTKWKLRVCLVGLWLWKKLLWAVSCGKSSCRL
jgi:hypothetical protein